MSLLIGGIAVALNVIVILMKLSAGKIGNAILDTCFLVGVLLVFQGSFNAMMVGTYASLAFSIYLFVRPPNLTSKLADNPKFKELKAELEARITERNK